MGDWEIRRGFVDLVRRGMAAENWMEIYRSYTAEDLVEEMEQLRKDVKGSFASQGSGGVQHSRDLQELRDRLQAATRVQNERAARGGGGNPHKGQVDFSGGRWGGL